MADLGAHRRRDRLRDAGLAGGPRGLPARDERLRPGAVEPMLPEALSNAACSLVPGEDRLAVTVEMDLRGSRVERSAFYRSTIRSDQRFDYERVDRLFAGEEPAQEPWAAPLAAARAAAGALDEARRSRGALVVDSSEPEFVFDRAGHVNRRLITEQTESHRVIEHLMIAANEQVARTLDERKVPRSIACTRTPIPSASSVSWSSSPRSTCPRRRCPRGCRPSRPATWWGRSRGSSTSTCRAPDTGAWRSARWCCARSSRRSTRRTTSATPACARRATATSPRRSAAIRTSSAIARCSPRWAGESKGPESSRLEEAGAWTSAREREAMSIERAGDDIAHCFLLERELAERGREQTFEGEVVGLIGAGAFVTFGGGTRGCCRCAACAASGGSSTSWGRCWRARARARRSAWATRHGGGRARRRAARESRPPPG